MTDEKSTNDDVTDKRLSLLVSLVVVGGAAALIAALVVAWLHPAQHPSVLVSAGLVGGITVGSLTHWRMRILSHGRGISWPEVGILVGLTLVPSPWVIIYTCLAVAIAKLIARMTVQKALYGVAKDVLAATAAGLVFTVFQA